MRNKTRGHGKRKNNAKRNRKEKTPYSMGQESRSQRVNGESICPSLSTGKLNEIAGKRMRFGKHGNCFRNVQKRHEDVSSNAVLDKHKNIWVSPTSVNNNTTMSYPISSLTFQSFYFPVVDTQSNIVFVYKPHEQRFLRNILTKITLLLHFNLPSKFSYTTLIRNVHLFLIFRKRYRSSIIYNSVYVASYHFLY